MAKAFEGGLGDVLDTEAFQAGLLGSSRPQGFALASCLRAEAREKLEQIRPRTLSQAGRVSGITPSDLALILLHLNQPGRA